MTFIDYLYSKRLKLLWLIRLLRICKHKKRVNQIKKEMKVTFQTTRKYLNTAIEFGLMNVAEVKNPVKHKLSKNPKGKMLRYYVTTEKGKKMLKELGWEV